MLTVFHKLRTGYRPMTGTLALISCLLQAPLGASPLGLYVEDGQLMRNGDPFRAMGINYFDCFVESLAGDQVPGYVEGFRVLKKDYQIPFLRFMAGPYAHTGWQLYVDDPETYFAKFDQLVAAAEEAGIGLIPSLFWYVATMPDLAGEPLSALGDPDSRCRRFMRRYAIEVVSRYKNSPAIWGWELGNEWLLFADLPGLNHLPKPRIGTREKRGPEDKLLRPMILDAYKDFHRTVRSIDPHRIIVTGDSITRAQAWHNRHKDAWGQDSREQWREIFLADTPDCYDVASFHLYASADKGYFSAKDLPLEAFVHEVAAFCREDGKVIWCGELGMPGTDDDARNLFFRMMGAVESNGIDLSAIWNFKPQGTAQAEWDISPVGTRAYMLDAVRDLNRRFAYGDWK